MEIKLLDFGYVNYIEHWGSDKRIIESARMSTDGGFRGWDNHWKCQECTNSYCIDMGTCKACGGGLKLVQSYKSFL